MNRIDLCPTVGMISYGHYIFSCLFWFFWCLFFALFQTLSVSFIFFWQFLGDVLHLSFLLSSPVLSFLLSSPILSFFSFLFLHSILFLSFLLFLFSLPPCTVLVQWLPPCSSASNCWFRTKFRSAWYFIACLPSYKIYIYQWTTLQLRKNKQTKSYHLCNIYILFFTLTVVYIQLGKDGKQRLGWDIKKHSFHCVACKHHI